MDGKKPTFVGLDGKDLSFFQAITLEASDMFFRELHCFVIDREKTKHDTMYGESKNPVYKDFWVRGQVEIKPNLASLTKFGINDTRDLAIYVDEGILRRGTGVSVEGENNEFSSENGGYQFPVEGDHFIVEGQRYIVMNAFHRDYYWHLEVPMTHAFFCNRMPDRSINDTQPVDSNNPAGPTAVPEYEKNDYFVGEK